MTVIHLKIEKSCDQVISGIPKSISLSTNISSSIFYTLDGSTPTINSDIYTGPIYLPINMLSVTLNVFATNGVLTSPVITECYTTDILHNARLPHSATSARPGGNLQDPYPYGTNEIEPHTKFLNPGDAGTTVFDHEKPGIPSGFNADGYGNAYTNHPYDIEHYEIVYTTRDAEGQPIIGNLPAHVKIEKEIKPQEETQLFSNFFDPRALVTFQDFSKEDPTGPINLNSQFFTSEDPERARDGNSFYNSGLDSPPVHGTFLRSHYNPRTNTISHYYYDSWSNRWIISTAPFAPTGPFDGNLAGIKSAAGGPGAKFIYEWNPWRYRTLF